MLTSSTDYQKAKSQYRESAKVPFGYDQEDLDRGFIANGLFQWSRHPSWAAEQTIWVSLYQWSCMITNQYFNWTAIGALSYLALFQGSTWLTEKITASKYPLYKEYQRRVGKFLPNLTYDETKPGNFYDMKAKPKVVKPIEEPKSSKKKN
jgi:steroid 5-alpha reductase family enzyme